MVLGPGEKRSTKSVQCIFNYEPKGQDIHSRRLVLLRDKDGRFLCYEATSKQLQQIDAAVDKMIGGMSDEAFISPSGANSPEHKPDVEYCLPFEAEHVDGFREGQPPPNIKLALAPPGGCIFSTTDSFVGRADDHFCTTLATIFLWNSDMSQANFDFLRPQKLVPLRPENQASEEALSRPDLSSYPPEKKFEGIASHIIGDLKKKFGDETLKIVVSLFNGPCKTIPNGFYSIVGNRSNFIFALYDFCDVTFIREDEPGAVKKDIVSLRQFEVVEFTGNAHHHVHYHNSVWGERSYLLVSVYDAEYSGGFHYQYCAPYDLYKNVVRFYCSENHFSFGYVFLISCWLFRRLALSKMLNRLCGEASRFLG